MNKSAIRKKILRLGHAHQAFLHAQRAVTLIGTLNVQDSDDLYSTLMASVATYYARPFLQSNGLGRLESDFEDFSSSVNREHLKRAHTDLMAMRHRLYAHKDMERTETWEAENSRENPPLDALHVVFYSDGFGIATRDVVLRSNFIPAITKLLGWQCIRSHYEIAKSLSILTGGTVPISGEYVITHEGLEKI